MLTYAAEVSGVIGLAVLCIGLPVTAAGLGIEALWSSLRRAGKNAQARAAAGRSL